MAADKKITLLGIIAVLGILIISAAIIVPLAYFDIKHNRTYDTYCGAGWNSVCITLPEGQQPIRDRGCITDGTNLICSSYSKVD
jgi:hypothetical protein